MIRIPFNKPHYTGSEVQNVLHALESRRLQGDGPFSKNAELRLQEITGSPKVLLTSSGTDALEMSCILGDIQPGDEVLMPSFTFVSTANAVVLRGAKTVFVDITNSTLNMDVSSLEMSRTSRSRAIIPVHYAGFSCDMTRLLDFATANKLIVIEDAAHAIGARRGGKPLGSFGKLGAFSFHETKNIICGEGGALAINDPEMISRAQAIRDKGTNRRKFLAGEVDRYTWVEVGSSFLPGELSAAVLAAQLENVCAINKLRSDLWLRYKRLLLPLQDAEKVLLPSPDSDEEGNGHIFHILSRSHSEREELRLTLLEQGIQATSHYEPLHLSPMGKKYWATHAGVRSMGLPNTESCATRLLRLPLYPDLQEHEQDDVVAAIFEFYKRSSN